MECKTTLSVMGIDRKSVPAHVIAAEPQASEADAHRIATDLN
jgi:hypothetical protein